MKSSEEYRFFRYSIKVVKVAKQEAVAKCGYASAGQLRDLPKPFLLCWEDGVQLDMKQPTQLRELTSSATGLSESAGICSNEYLAIQHGPFAIFDKPKSAKFVGPTPYRVINKIITRCFPHANSQGKAASLATPMLVSRYCLQAQQRLHR